MNPIIVKTTSAINSAWRVRIRPKRTESKVGCGFATDGPVFTVDAPMAPNAPVNRSSIPTVIIASRNVLRSALGLDCAEIKLATIVLYTTH